MVTVGLDGAAAACAAGSSGRELCPVSALRSARALSTGPLIPPTFTTVTPRTVLPSIGASGRSVSRSRASTGAVAVGARFPDAGSGYWCRSHRGSRPEQQQRAHVHAASDHQPCTRARASPPAPVAIDATGNSGTQSPVERLRLATDPDNGNACDPKLAPPARGDARLGQRRRSRSPGAHAERQDRRWQGAEHRRKGTARSTPRLPGTGVLDFDSNAHCIDEARPARTWCSRTSPRWAPTSCTSTCSSRAGEQGTNQLEPYVVCAWRRSGRIPRARELPPSRRARRRRKRTPARSSASSSPNSRFSSQNRNRGTSPC